MKIVKFKFEVDLSKRDQINALYTLLRAIGGQESTTEPIVGEVLETTEKGIDAEKPKKKRRTQAEIKAEKEAAQTEEAEDEGVSSTEESNPAFTEVRALFAKKLQEGDDDTRESCISKLSELGAKNLPALQKEDYQKFIDFLNGL